MGTVGLNFGSATSGTGFDVSSTVAEIVGNLQKVETPWKTQLTKLESQDTAISSLGTLFSNLSNALNSLTDFQGIMAQKEGSSSDQNVLTLTAANSSAVAGTHTVAVTNLALTSSGYLATVSDASAAITGSVTLSVGSWKSQVISVPTTEGKNNLNGLAAAINSSGVGITASVLTDSSGSRLSLVSGTSGAGGNISISANTITTTSPTGLSYTGTAGTSSTTSTGTLSPVGTAGDTLMGTISIQVGSQPAQSVSMSVVANSLGSPTLANLAAYITNNSATFGASATVVTNSDGTSSLSLTSGTAGSAGTLTVTPSMADSSLFYTSTVSGKDAQISVDGINLTSASNTVANLIPGVTFQLLAPSAKESDQSLEQVQVVIANDNGGVESAVASMVSDYNAAISGINTQEGNDSSGNPEPLFGSPTLSLLQQQLLGTLNVQSPSGYMDSISSTNGTTLSGQMTIQMGNLGEATFVVGSGSDSETPGTFYTDNTDAGGVNQGDTIAGLAATINAASSNPALTYFGTAGTDATDTESATTSSGTLSGIADTSDALSGSISIQMGDGTAETVVIGAAPSSPVDNTIYTGSGADTLADVVNAINGANNGAGIGVKATTVSGGNGTTSLSLTSTTSGSAGSLTVTSSLLDTDTVGVTAGVKTANGQSTLTLVSQTAGSGGALAVTSKIVALAPTALSYSDTKGYTASMPDSGTLGSVASSNDVLSGSITVQVGSNTSETFNLDAADGTNTLSGLLSAINSGNFGFTASGIPNNDSPTSISLTSGTVGSAGALRITSNVFDTTNKTSTTLDYTNSSDINSLTSLGISVNNDGSLTLNANSLNSVLNTDYSSVVGFFQNANGWGQTFSDMLRNAGTSATTGILALASSSNSNIESTLNADISKEDRLISAQQKSLTAELNGANEIMQALPSQLASVNELYSAITGYNQRTGG